MASVQTTLNPANPSPKKSIRAAYAQHILREHLLAKLNAASPDRHHDSLPKTPPLPRRGKDAGPYTGSICIVGAGVTGLYLGMMLKFLGITNFQIFEGNNRIGGRLYTHRFKPNVDPEDDVHNYYDIGAMRVPDLEWMQPTLDLMKYLELDIKPYYYNNGAGETNPCSYHYKHMPIDGEKFNTFIAPYVAPFNENFNAALANWLSPRSVFDNYSMRGYLMTGLQLENPPQENWSYHDTATAELYDTSTGLFDQAFTEMVIDYADFQNASTVDWWRVEGGGQRISDAMYRLLVTPEWPDAENITAPSRIYTSRPVTALSISDNGEKIAVTYSSTWTENFDMVFNTTALGPLQKMDIKGLELADDALDNIRSLSYDRATKVAIKFSRPWWFEQEPPTVYGGISGSDLPIRSVVYPSWNDGPDKPAVLMVSYTWAQDATRMASMVPVYTGPAGEAGGPQKSDPIVKLCLENLVQLWSGQPNPPSYELLYGLYMEHHAFAWENDPWTGGAYALYGPGQYKEVYPKFIQLYCNNKFAMCGEAISAHHAWISGSLDSAYLKLEQFLIVNNLTDELEKLQDSIFGGGEGQPPEEMDEELIKWAVLLSEGGGPKGWGDGFNLKKPHRESSKTWKTSV